MRRSPQSRDSKPSEIVKKGDVSSEAKIFKKMALEKCSKKLERSTRVSPQPLRLPPNAITSEQVIRYHRNQRRGGMGGQALSPPYLTCPVIS